MIGTYKNNESDFYSTVPLDGTVNVLVSGSFSKLSQFDSVTGEYIYNSGSWGYDESTKQFSVVEDNLVGDISIVGLTISTVDSQGRSRALELATCNKVQLTIKLGNYRQSHVLDVLPKSVGGEFVALEVQPVLKLDTSLIQKVKLQFSGEHDSIDSSLDKTVYTGCDCEVGSVPVEITVEPVKYDAEFAAFDPLLNNELSIVPSTIAYRIETVSINGNLKLKNVELANIPDYYFTSRALQVGKYLGTKISYTTRYRDSKEDFTEQNINSISGSVYNSGTGSISYCNQDLQPGTVLMTGKDRPFFTVQSFSGSVFSVDGKDSTVENIKKIGASSAKVQQLGFIKKAILVSTDKTKPEEYNYVTTRPFYHEYSDEGGNVKNYSENLPAEYDIVVDQSMGTTYRVTQKYIYIRETGQVARTNEYGHIVSIV